ncbi:hypothetical protein LSCM1_06929 [Leishmania martiniquensis]|uniref:Membrane transporter n=1 Tax=Leishmania martiniquensis TaxID=1580590 RepID=A0A836HUN2_9TRYP|nr:hypothetical protein LSCM1_06929 [Leishmania martiniquensis]
MTFEEACQDGDGEETLGPRTALLPTSSIFPIHSPLARDPLATANAPSLSSGRLSSYSPNVLFTLCFNFVDGSCYSMWAMQLLPVFLLSTSSSVVTVSFSASVSGVAQLLGAMAAGCVADRHPRQRCIRAGAAFAAVALAIFACAFWTSQVWLILCAQALWGLYTGITSTAVEALFADSVPQGQRTAIYNVKWVIQTLCYVVGYGTAALLFIAWGNDWGPRRLRVVMTLGAAVHPIALVPLCWLQDRYAVPEGCGVASCGDPPRNFAAADAASASEPAPARAAIVEHAGVLEPSVCPAVKSVAQEPRSPGTAPAAGAGGADLPDAPSGCARFQFTEALPLSDSTVALGRESCEDGAGGIRESTGTAVQDAIREGLISASAKGIGTCRQQRWPNRIGASHEAGERLPPVRHVVGSLKRCRWYGLLSLPSVPYWISLVDILLAIGSGMSLPYFPLFFASERHVSPAGLNGIYIASTLLTAATSMCLPWLIHTCGLGRVLTALCVRLVGTAALFVLAIARPPSAVAALPGIVSLFLCRNALMNSVFGVTRSVIMDCVTKDSRAKWSALESVSSVSWAGSAVVGGYLTMWYGYRSSFIATAVLQLTATLLMIPAAFGARALDTPPR